MGLVASGQPVDICPVADGGEGTLSALAAGLGLEQITVRVSDPLGHPVEAVFGLGPNDVAVVEMAAASGLGLVAEMDRDAVAASSYGTGELIAAAAAAGARTVYVAVGGSATTDGGEGALLAIEDLGGLGSRRLVVLCDVRTPFELAPSTFAPQKGASAEQVSQLERRLDHLAARLPRDPRGVPMTGAAGGLAGGLWAQFGAELVGGASFVLSALDYDARMRAARAVVTGEGRLDRQSLSASSSPRWRRARARPGCRATPSSARAARPVRRCGSSTCSWCSRRRRWPSSRRRAPSSASRSGGVGAGPLSRVSRFSARTPGAGLPCAAAAVRRATRAASVSSRICSSSSSAMSRLIPARTTILQHAEVLTVLRERVSGDQPTAPAHVRGDVVHRVVAHLVLEREREHRQLVARG